MGLVSMTRTNSKVMPINNNDYSCHIRNSCRTCLTNRMESILRHITSLVINSLRVDKHTHTHTHTNTHTYRCCTETILRNQVRAWFKKHCLAHLQDLIPTLAGITVRHRNFTSKNFLSRVPSDKN